MQRQNIVVERLRRASPALALAVFGLTVVASEQVAVPAAVAPPQAPNPAVAPCAATTPVRATAPPDPNVNGGAVGGPGWWHISDDKALWAPSSPPGEASVGVGSYWVRPAGQALTIRARRLDGDAPPVEMIEGEDDHYWKMGFFYGGPSTPTEGCWEFEVTSGPSRVTFVKEIHLRFEAFLARPQTRTVFENQLGRIESGGTSLAVTALVIEDPATRTRRLGGARLDLRDGTRSATLYERFERLEGTRPTLERAAAGGFPTMIYGLGGYNIVQGEFLTIRGREHTFRFTAHTHADAARLLVAAGDVLRTRLQ
jgi:hypothetical protein